MKYTNKQLKDICKKQGIHNDHNFANGEVYISYHPATYGRGSQSARWNVTLAGFSLSDKWYDHGSKTFGVYRREEKESKLGEAKAYVTANWPSIHEFARGPFGAYYAKEFVAKRLAEIISKHEAENA